MKYFFSKIEAKLCMAHVFLKCFGLIFGPRRVGAVQFSILPKLRETKIATHFYPLSACFHSLYPLKTFLFLNGSMCFNKLIPRRFVNYVKF